MTNPQFYSCAGGGQQTATVQKNDEKIKEYTQLLETTRIICSNTSNDPSLHFLPVMVNCCPLKTAKIILMFLYYHITLQGDYGVDRELKKQM